MSDPLFATQADGLSVESDSGPRARPVLRPVTDSRPPAPRSRPCSVVFRAEHGPGSLPPPVDLPDPGRWAAVVGLAVGQALIGSRPVGQLENWLTVALLADLRCAVRQRVRAAHGRPARTVPSVRVVSVRTQVPAPAVVEAAIHLRIGSGSMALAARLEGSGPRWICTALDRAEATGSVSELRPGRGRA